jgi:RNA polymerase sigma factor (sigma-70 family)
MDDRACYTVLFAPTYKFFHYKYVPREDIEDLCQEVFIRLFTKYKPTEMDETERLKLTYTIARNVYREWVRHSMKHQVVWFDESMAEPDDEAWLGFQLDATEEEPDPSEAEKEMLEAALLKLPDKLALVIRRRFLEEKTREEVAQELGCKEKHVHVYQRRALAMLRHVVQDTVSPKA